MARYYLIIILAFAPVIAEGQYFQAVRGIRDGLYAEVYLTPRDFSTGFVSINYEKFFGSKFRNSFRIGVMPDFKSMISFPVTVSYITKPYDNHHLEIGAGFILNVDFFEGQPYFDVASGIFPVMYRYTNGTRFYFRAGLNIFYSWPVMPTPSLSMGYRF
jgi:hypothetical protein